MIKTATIVWDETEAQFSRLKPVDAADVIRSIMRDRKAKVPHFGLGDVVGWGCLWKFHEP